MRILLAAVLLAAPAMAQNGLRELCADRPGLDTPACTVDAGHLQIELGLGNWTLDKNADSRIDTIVAGDISGRYGLGDTSELRVGWAAYGHLRTRDRATGTIDTVSGTGDVTIGLKQNLSHPDGNGFALALLPSVTFATGMHGVGAGDWAAGLLVPMSYDLTEQLTLEITPELDAAVDADRNGRHAAYGSAAGLGVKLGDKISASVEAQLIRDRDPAGRSTQTLGGVYFAYQPKDRIQFDLGAQAGLDRAAPDVELYFGISEKF